MTNRSTVGRRLYVNYLYLLELALFPLLIPRCYFAVPLPAWARKAQEEIGYHSEISHLHYDLKHQLSEVETDMRLSASAQKSMIRKHE